ncbi:hypothetical protein KJ855_04600, partial [Patescibacteria group bacterium]|nr:hypothetical protein [Patescibacteria group bacterium]
VISEQKGKDVDFYPPSTKPVIVYGVVIVLVTLLLGGVLWYARYDQGKKADEQQVKISVIEKEMDQLDSDGNLVSIAQRLTSSAKAYEKYVKNQISWPIFLDKVRNNTLQEVTYSSFAVDRPKGSFKVDGVAPSYRIVAEQLHLFLNDKNYKDVKLNTVVLRPESESKSRVAFTMELTPVVDAFMEVEEVEDVFDMIGEEDLTSPAAEEGLTEVVR